MPTRDDWLNQGLLLTDHPFEPVRDPVHGLDLRALKVSFSKPLNVFAKDELATYVEPVGGFDAAISGISSFLAGLGTRLDENAPPVVLIEGPGGTGRKTIGNFAAYLMKSHCTNAPAFQTVPVTTNHFGRLLFDVKQALEDHFTEKGISTTPIQSSDKFIKSEDPDESVLASLFNRVAQRNLNPPLLALLIGPIEFTNFDWISKLHKMLKDLGVALIFTTESDLVTERFKKAVTRGEYVGCPVRLSPLTMHEGMLLITHRLTLFRSDPLPGGLAPLTPYEEAAISWIFDSGAKNLAVKLLLNLCRSSLNRKLADLVASAKQVPVPGSPALQISRRDLEEAYGTALRQKGWGGQ